MPIARAARLFEVVTEVAQRERAALPPNLLIDD
jgi:hypothetical protein